MLVLADGRRLAAPLPWVGPKVVAMSPDERAKWVISASGCGVNWPAAGQASADGALDVWALEEDALYEGALAELREADGDVSALSPRTRSLVALWRLVADVNNGGFMQFLGNWGIAEVYAADAALMEAGADATLAVLRRFWADLGSIAEAEDVNTLNDVYARIDDAVSERISDCDEDFWDTATELTRLVPLHYGPAPSA